MFFCINDTISSQWYFWYIVIFSRFSRFTKNAGPKTKKIEI